MNVLILTGNFGMGHKSTSEAIKEEIYTQYPNADINTIDIMDYLFPKSSGIIYSAFNMVVQKWSNLYNTLNKISDKYKGIPMKNILMQKIDKLLSFYSPDIIVSTLHISSQYISAYKELRNINIPLITCITDISTHNEWLCEKTNAYLVGSQHSKHELIDKGIDEKKIYVADIPVKQNFKNFNCHTVCKKKEILIMGGGLGLIPDAKQLLASLNSNEYLHATVITGRNTKLFNALEKTYGNIKIIGYTNEVYKYMKQADLLISKAGGITLFESIYSDTPLFVIHPFLEQEIGNAHYVENKEIGKVIWNKNRPFIPEILNTLDNDIQLAKMKKNMTKIKKQIEPISINNAINDLLIGA